MLSYCILEMLYSAETAMTTQNWRDESMSSSC